MIHQPLSHDGVHPQISSSLKLLVLCFVRSDLFVINFCLYIFFKELISFIGSLDKCHTSIFNALIITSISSRSSNKVPFRVTGHKWLAIWIIQGPCTPAALPCSFQRLISIAVASAVVHAIPVFFLPILRTKFFQSHWLLSSITVVETMDSSERGMDPVAMIIINPQKEYWSSLGSNQRLPDRKSCVQLTEL